MRKLLLAALFLYVINDSYSQWKYTTWSMPSPNAASLGTYGEIPISHYTGTPNISIPLYELKANKINLPVSLSYHPGVRPDQHPGWTGIGWSLFCGGAISRKLNKMPDEQDADAFFWNPGYYFNNNLINNSNWSATSVLSNWSGYEIGYDVEPDEFSFSFMGYSGKFFLDHTGQWRVQCDADIKVIFNPADFAYPYIYYEFYGSWSPWISKTFMKFTLIDGNGTKYTFGGAESAIEYSDEIAPDPGRRAELFMPTSWFLTKIESADGSEVINLNYVRGPYVSHLYKGYNSMYLNASDGAFLDPGCSSWSASVKSNGRVTSPVYLSSVEMPVQNIRIDFNGSKCNDLVYTDQDYLTVMTDLFGSATLDDYLLLGHTTGLVWDNPSDANLDPKFKRFIWRKLDAINIVQTISNTTLRKINFNYLEQTTRRLRLSSLVSKDVNNTTVNTWSFAYNDNILLPTYMTKIGDHWGFNNNTNLPTNIMATDFFAARQPDPFYSQAEVLTSITYPTGGISEFEFELNNYSAYVTQERTALVNENASAGGLRVKKITNKENGIVREVREYFYVKNYTVGANPALLTSSGILDSKPKYTFVNANGMDYAGNSFFYTFTSSNPVVPVTQNSTGTHIGYSEVVEKRNDNSFTIFKYTNHDNGFMDNTPVNTFNRTFVAYYPFSSRDFERGELLRKTDYKSNGKIVLETVNEYARINESAKVARAVENSFFVVCANNASRSAVSRSAYYIYYYPFVLSKQTVKEYSSGDELTSIFGTTEKTFVYNEDKTLKSESYKTSTGETITTNYKYPADYPFDPVLTAMTNAHIISPAIETAIIKNFTPVKLMRTNYYTPHTNVHVPQTKQIQIGSNTIQTRQQFHQYDTKGNVLEESEVNDVHTVYLYGYNSQFVVAKISNSTLASVQSAMTTSGITQGQLDGAGSMTDQALRTLLNGLRTNLPNALVATYTFSPGMGMTSATDIRGKTTFYEYDAFQRLKLVKDQDGNIVKTFQYQFKQ